MEENEIIHPFYSGPDAMEIKDTQACISNGSLNPTSGSQAFNSDMLHENMVSPLYWQVLLVHREDW